MKEHCHRCHRILTPDNKFPVKGRDFEVCRECADEKYLQCDQCHQYVCEQDLIDAESRSVCIWCLCDHYLLCPHCGAFVSAANAVRFHGHWLCRDCKEEYFRSCDGCHQKFEEDELEEIQRGRKIVLLCRNCREGKYVLCDECREWIPADAVLHWHGRTLCKECAADDCAVCDSCKKTVATDDMMQITVDGRSIHICAGCFKLKYSKCDGCGGIFPHRKLYVVELEHYCEECLRLLRENIRHARLNALGATVAGIAAGAALSKALFDPPKSGSASSDVFPVEPECFSGDYVGDGLDESGDYIGDGLDS